MVVVSLCGAAAAAWCYRADPSGGAARCGLSRHAPCTRRPLVPWVEVTRRSSPRTQRGWQHLQGVGVARTPMWEHQGHGGFPAQPRSAQCSRNLCPSRHPGAVACSASPHSGPSPCPISGSHPSPVVPSPQTALIPLPPGHFSTSGGLSPAPPAGCLLGHPESSLCRVLEGPGVSLGESERQARLGP